MKQIKNQTRGSKRTSTQKSLREFSQISKNLDEVPDYIHRLPGLGLPDRMFATLAYDQDQFSLVNAATAGSHLFSGNSCFDPDTSGVGHQPMYFDQFAQLYNRYRVHRSEIVLELLNSTIASHLTITPTTDGTWPTTLQQALESTYTCSIPVSSSVFRTVRERSISTRKIWGMQSITQDDLYQAVYSASPVRQWYWKLMAVSFDGVTNVSVRVNIRVVYEVEFFDRFPTGVSLQNERSGMKYSLHDDGSTKSSSVVVGESTGKQCQCRH